MNHRVHKGDELRGNAWVFPTGIIIEAVINTILKNEDLRKKLDRVGCSVIDRDNKKKMIVFVHCSSVDKKAVSEVGQLMKKCGGKKLTIQETKPLIQSVYLKATLRFSLEGHPIEKRWN